MRHVVELTARDIQQIVADHINRSDLGVSVVLEDVVFKIETYDYGDKQEFAGVDVIIDEA